MKSIKHTAVATAVAVAASVACVCAAAAPTIPDAGSAFRPSPTVKSSVEPDPLRLVAPQDATDIAPGGQSVRITNVTVTGNTVLSPLTVDEWSANYINKDLDLAGLHAAAAKLTDIYRRAGYVFATAFLPEQEIQGGELTVRVMEGSIGLIAVTSPHAAAVASYVDGLSSGDILFAPALESAISSLQKLPGVRAIASVSPGALPGSGDLAIDVQIEPYSGEVRFDNSGSEYVGRNRVQASVGFNSLIRFGDQLQVSYLASDERLRNGSVQYSVPVAVAGARVNAGYARTTYGLVKEFSKLMAAGVASTTSVAASYPIGLVSNTVRFEYKELNDTRAAVNFASEKVARNLVLESAYTNHSGESLYSATVALTGGTIDDSGTKKIYTKLNLEASSVQRITGSMSLFARISAQLTPDVLDSSEAFYIGGPTAVRAYSVGEAGASKGLLGQVEARYQVGAATVYGFADAGRVGEGVQARDLSGYGFGVRYLAGPFSADVSAAWRAGNASADSATSPVYWAALSYRF